MVIPQVAVIPRRENSAAMDARRIRAKIAINYDVAEWFRLSRISKCSLSLFLSLFIVKMRDLCIWSWNTFVSVFSRERSWQEHTGDRWVQVAKSFLLILIPLLSLILSPVGRLPSIDFVESLRDPFRARGSLVPLRIYEFSGNPARSKDSR